MQSHVQTKALNLASYHKSKLCLSLCIISGNSWGHCALFLVVVTCFRNRFSLCRPGCPETHSSPARPSECWGFRSVLLYSTLTLRCLFDMYMVYTCMMFECMCAVVHAEARGTCDVSLSLSCSLQTVFLVEPEPDISRVLASKPQQSSCLCAHF